jgi:methyltransferase
VVSGSRLFFFALLAAWGGERLFEVVLSRRNARRALARGGVEVESGGFYAAMVVVHGLLFFAAPLEVIVARRPFVPALAAAATAALAGAMALRYWAVATLGDRWNTRLIVVPGEPAATGGPYRFVRHPNYVAVAVEMAALPLVHTAWISALAWSAASAVLLALRVPREEAALARASDYARRLGDRPRFVPGARRPGSGG